MADGNLLRGIPDELPQELFQNLLDARSLRIERIVSRGHASPEGFWYDQEEHEWVMLLSGSACLRFAGEAKPRLLEAGDYLLIPARTRHRVEQTATHQDSIWLAIFFRD